MDHSLDTIKDMYSNTLKDYVYISKDVLAGLEPNRPIKAINKQTLKLDYGGIIRNLDNRDSFIRFYDIQSKRYRNFYTNNNYLFYKPKKVKANPFRDYLEVIVKKMDSN